MERSNRFSTYEVFNIIKFIDSKSWLSGSGRSGKEELLINEHKVSGKQDEYVLEICYTTLYP